MASALSEEQFGCSICLDIFHDPVSIPCGHNFCVGCIKRFWDTRSTSMCPLCKEAFTKQPELRINVGLRDITEQFKRSLRCNPNIKPTPAKRRIPRQPSKSDHVPCDVCNEDKSGAVKSCLVCRQSYCETHLTPHLRDQHMLTDPGTFVTSHLCRKHNRLLEKFCRTDSTLVCATCREREHRHHEVVPMEDESRRIKSEMTKTEAQLQRMVRERMRKSEEITASVELSKRNKEREAQTRAQFVAMASSAIETLLVDDIEQKQEAAERSANELLKELQQETDELLRRCSELQHLEHTKDPLHLLQNFPSLSAPLSTRDWTKVKINSESHAGTVREVFSKLVDFCHRLEKKLSAEEISEINQYAVDVTLDPVTAAGWLVLSPDGKRVSLGCSQRNLAVPGDPRRFDSCTAVLGKQSFTSGRHYWVVQVGNKTDWDLGVARVSISKKGLITVRPDNGYWAICRRKGGCLRACAGPPVSLHLQEIPQKVGVFLDYEEGSVSFYDTEAKTHIYTYSGCSFAEPLCPYFNPCLHDNGRNTAPLIICPVEVTQTATL